MPGRGIFLRCIGVGNRGISQKVPRLAEASRGNGSNRKGAKGVSTLLGWWVVRLRGAMHLDTEKAVTALMTVAIAGVGPACIGLMLLL